MKIDEEIMSLKRTLDLKAAMGLDYLNPELKYLQALVLTTHAHIEGRLESRIWMKIKREIDPKGEIKNKFFLLKSLTLQDLLTKFSFMEKLNIVKNFKDGVPEEDIKKVNRYRIEFAHPDGTHLRVKYNQKTSEGKIEIRNLLRALIKCEKSTNTYYLSFIRSRSG